MPATTRMGNSALRTIVRIPPRYPVRQGITLGHGGVATVDPTRPSEQSRSAIALSERRLPTCDRLAAHEAPTALKYRARATPRTRADQSADAGNALPLAADQTGLSFGD